MLTNTLISKIFKMTPQGIGKWKKENRPIINLIQKYFSEKDIQEFLSTGEIFKQEILTHYEFELLEEVEDFLFDLGDLRIEFLFTFLYLSKEELLENYSKSSFSFYDYYLYDTLENFKMKYKGEAVGSLKINDFDEQYKELHIKMMKIKYPIYKYLVHNLRYDFSAFISQYPVKTTQNIQDVILMMPFLKINDFKNINTFRNLHYFNRDDIHNIIKNKPILLEIIQAKNNIEKIKEIVSVI